MKTKGSLSFRVKCEKCGGKCCVYNTESDGRRYFRCQVCAFRFVLFVKGARS